MLPWNKMYQTKITQAQNVFTRNDTFNYRDWKERNRKLELERRKLQKDGMSKYADHAETERRAIEENNELSPDQKKKLKIYLTKLLAVQHLVAKKGDTVEFIQVVEIKQMFIQNLEIL